ESGEKLIGLDKEIKILSDYLNLEMMRYNERLTVSFEKSIDKNYYQILPLLLLPFIENAFKHGISESRFESFITIDINVLNGHLSFIVENSKDAAPCIKTPKNIGLSNVTRQLELTYQDFKLDVKDNGNTFKIDLYINLKSHVEI
ncbi:MAG: histidine kinase, partial [Ferruginibacter sp.]